MKYLYGFLVLLALLVAALFLVPPFLDWERFKPEITERLEAITGRKLALDGAIAVSILPSPTITVADLRILSAPGATAPDLARIKSLDLALALGPLLGGEVAVTSLEMVEPVIELERSADGRPNWRVDRAAEEAPAETAAAEREDTDLAPTRIDSATVSNGVIVYRRGDGAPPERIERIDAVLSARTLDGPFRAEGEFAVRGRAIAFQFATGAIGEDRTMPLSLEATFGGGSGTALFEGSVHGIDAIPAFDGTVRAQAADLAALLSALDVDRGALPEAPLASAFSAKGTLRAGIDSVVARELQVRLGESQASGALSWQGGAVPAFDADIALDRIDLDRFLPAGDRSAPGQAAEPGGAESATGPGGAEEAGGAAPAAFAPTTLEDIRRAIPRDIAATVAVSIGTLTWHQGVIRQARAQLALDTGVVSIGRASALLPGGADVSLSGRLTGDGDGPWLEGAAEIAADDLRAVLSWLDLDVDAIPADRLRRLSASADLSGRGDLVSASNLDIRVDAARIAGAASLAAGERPRLAARLAVDTVNIDAYLPADDTAPAPEPGGGEAAVPETAPQDPAPADDGGWEALAGFDADVALTIDSLTYEGVRLAGLGLDAALEDGDLTVRRAQVADVVGASVSVAGTAHTVWTRPTLDLTITGAADSLDGVAALLEIDPDIRSEAFGRIGLEGTLAGDTEALELDLELNTATANASLRGSVETPFGTPAAALALGLHTSDAAALARTAGLTPPPVVARLGTLKLDGGIGGTLESAAINLGVETAGATLTLSGTVEDPLASPTYRLDVDLSHPRAEALIETMGGEAPADALGALHVAGRVSGDADAADITNIDAALGESRIGGEVSLRLDRTPPAFSANLRAGALDLAWLGGGLAAAGGAESGGAEAAGAGIAGADPDGAAPVPERWSDKPVDLAVLDRLDGTLALEAEALILGAYRIEQAGVDLAAEPGTLTLRALRGRLFDGALEADGSLATGPAPAGQGAFRLTDADLGAVLLEAAGVDAVSGSATIDGYFILRGATAREMVRSLAGRVAIAGRGGAVEGVDLPAISRQIGALAEADALDDIASFVAGTEHGLSSGRTAIRSLDGAVRVQDGQARIDDVRVVVDGGVGAIDGSADLPAWVLDLTALFRLVEHPEAPPVGVRLEGPIDRPGRRYLIADMQAHLVELGLLSLARSQDGPTITIRKGAKAEPGTEMDRLLRETYGDPEEAEEEAEEAPDPEPGTQTGALLPDVSDDPREGKAEEEEAREAQAEPDSGIDELLRDLLDAPREARDGEEESSQAEEPAPAGRAGDAAAPRPAEEPGDAAESNTAAPISPAVETGQGPASAGVRDGGDADDIGPADGTGPTDRAEELEGADGVEEAAAAEASDGEREGAAPPQAGEVPLPPLTPERDPGEELRDFVDDLLRSLDEE